MHRWFGPGLEVLRALLASPAAPDPDVVVRSAPHGADAVELRAPSEYAVADDLIVGPPEPLDDCEARLRRAGVRFEPGRIPVHEKGSITCGAEQIVHYQGSEAGIRWRGSPRVTCQVALALARFDAIVQEEARRHLDRDVVRIEHLGTYNCREMAAYPGWVSEHSYANAIDVRRFVLRGGRKVEVLGNYGDGEGAEPGDRVAAFLQAIAHRAYDEDVFSVVLTPAFDRAHRNHFHLDFARYRVDGSRPE